VFELAALLVPVPVLPPAVVVGVGVVPGAAGVLAAGELAAGVVAAESVAEGAEAADDEAAAAQSAGLPAKTVKGAVEEVWPVLVSLRRRKILEFAGCLHNQLNEVPVRVLPRSSMGWAAGLSAGRITIW